MKALLFVIVVALLPVAAFAQAMDSTPAGHELNLGLSGYNYIEPGSLKISIHGLKFSGEYKGTVPLNTRRHWVFTANARASSGNVTYDGWCAPWLITPDSASPNGYALDLGDYSACDDAGNRDWYLEARGLIGKDVIGQSWTWSFESGLGVRHLSNGISGLSGFRTDEYLYLPIALTARTKLSPHRALAVSVEYDRLLRGWQTTRDSALGSGVVPATTTAPAFTINGFTDFSFEQHAGWALRASANYQISRMVSIEPYYIHWRVADSSVSIGTATFTVNGSRAEQQLGAYEPLNTTREAGIKLAFHFF